jgi:hypothetical protein
MNFLKKDNNKYFINSRRTFNPLINFDENIVKMVFDFAFDMTFGKVGEHRAYRSGGQYNRKNGQLFINTFQGKLAEFGIYNFFINNGFKNMDKPDLSKWELGKWDETDIILNSLKISIKSTKHFGNLLLLETKDWNEEGHYIPNLNSTASKSDLFILTRVSPDGESIMKRERLYFSNTINEGKEYLYKIISSENWEFDIAGFIDFDKLKYLISNKYILPQNSLLNGKIKMDAENYYIQSGDMSTSEDLIELFNT